MTPSGSAAARPSDVPIGIPGQRLGFGPEGIYRGLCLYAFADNHDVDRVASTLGEPAHLYPLYSLLLTMPGAPSIYYGSEWGIEGRKDRGTDAPLRPPFDPATTPQHAAHPDLYRAIRSLIGLRHRHPALRRGDYLQLHVAHEQFAFMRQDAFSAIVVAVNAAHRLVEIPLSLPGGLHGRLVDALNDGDAFDLSGGRCALPLHPHWARMLVAEH
jgi:glycosidase